MASSQFVIFKINDESFGIEITEVREIIKPVEVFKIPDSPEYIEGLFNLRGKVHTVFNLRKRFHFPEKPHGENTKMVIISLNSILISFIVDEVNEIVRIEEENIIKIHSEEHDSSKYNPIVPSLERKYIKGIAEIKNKSVVLLDLDKVFLESEKEELEQFVQSL